MSDDSTRRQFLVAAGGGATTVLAGCTGDSSGNNSTEEDEQDSPTETQAASDTPTRTTTANQGGTLQLMAQDPIQTLDPVAATGAGAGYGQYGRSLMEFPDGLYPPEAALVNDYSISDDGLIYTFQLKQGVKFHDGSELTAEDVVYTYRRLAGSPNSTIQSDIIGDLMTIEHEKDPSRSDPPDERTLEDYIPESLAVEAMDRYTFRFTLRSPFQYTLFNIAGRAWEILPANAVGDIKGYEGEYGYNEFFSTANGGPKYTGVGPFKIDSWVKGSKLKLSAFDEYYGKGPQLDGITYTVITSANTRLQRFKNGNADILEGITTASFNPDNVSIETENGSRSVGKYTFGDGTVVNYGEVPALSTEYILFNCLRVPLPVRRAFAYVMNQDDIARKVYKGTAKAAYHITPPDPYPTFEDGVSSVETYDRHAKDGYMSTTEFGADGYPYGYGETRIQDAKQVMEEADYGPDNRFKITATTIAGNNAYLSVFKQLQTKLRAAHINLEIEQADFGTITRRAINGDMDVFSLGDGMEFPTPVDFLRYLHAGNPSSGFTRWGAEGGYFRQEYVDTAHRAWEENYAADDATEESRAEAFQTIEEMNWASVQELPTIHPTDQRLWHDYVDVEMHGVMENQTHNQVTLNR